MEKIKTPRKSIEVEEEMMELRLRYKLWREDNKKNKKGFFIIYNSFYSNNILKNLSGNALKLYIYLGIHSNNETGELWHSVEKIADYFECDKRTVQRWFKELEDNNLICRIQKGYKRIANTFLKPY